MIENLWRTLDTVNAWIKNSETKAVALLAAQGVLLGLLAKVFDGSITEPNKSQMVWAGLGIACNAISMFCAFRCLNPRLVTPAISSTYFGSIATRFRSGLEYKEHVERAFSTEPQVRTELTNQIHVNSTIAWKKFRNTTYSLRWCAAGLVCWCVLIVLLVWK